MSAFDSDDEEEIGLLMEGGVRPKNENYLRDTVSQYTDTQFREHFRLSRGVAAYLTQIYAASPAYQENSTGGNGKLGAYEQVLIFLWFAGHQTASFRDVADRFNITISSLFRVNIRLIHFISGLAEEVIRWPSRQEQTTIEASFRRKGFPGVVGAIDGTHVRIDKPAVDPDSYCNRKKYFSVQMQAVCDHQGKIRSVFIGFPGSVHDARVFTRSDFGVNIAAMCGNYIVLGDSAYPCLRNLITPFKDFGRLTRSHKRFNKTLSSCRSVIEHCFGMLKQRFRQLYHCKLRSMENIAHFIRACCVLHNLAVDDNPELTFADPDISEVGDEEVLGHREDEDIPDSSEGVAYRNYLLAAF
ncbi:hypothetical protein GE061_009061 [Apolygus lucorum]|uniref:DDE Tnp4 domain-containing protein n=1 Tax=Apolygus lucorum TaxID=248454 RepID=A0A8S9Y184_APOLU|nr:hypothetical protein GE061_009061 [Apolygus lucorum]